MKLVIGCDHGGFALKGMLKQHAEGQGHTVDDVGCHSADAVDYPDFAAEVARRVAAGRADAGIMIDGAGIGSAMAANKIKGIRAACCNDLYTAANSREHNHANVLTLGSMVVGPGLARKIADVFLGTQPAAGRHADRVNKIMALEQAAGPIGGGAEDAIQSIVASILDKLLAPSANPPAVQPGGPLPVPQPARLERGVVTEQQIREMARNGQRELRISSSVIVTPLARDTARELKINLDRC